MAAEVWDDVLDQLRMLVRLTKQIAHRHFPAYDGLAPALMGVLGMLVREGDIRLTVLAERQHVDASVASRQVAELEGRGLVERSRDPDDARAHLLRVTPAGRDLHERARVRQLAVVRDVLGAWSDDDARALVHQLTRLNDDLRGEACRAPQTPDRSPSPSIDANVAAGGAGGHRTTLEGLVS